jgi:hypothetical protein
VQVTVSPEPEPKPRRAPFEDGVTLDLVEMRRAHEAIVEGEIRAGRMEPPDSFEACGPFGRRDVDWFW